MIILSVGILQTGEMISFNCLCDGWEEAEWKDERHSLDSINIIFNRFNILERISKY